MIIIPDIHGRTFWKDAVKERKPGEKIIFLGDYLDPYPYEWENGQDPEFEYPIDSEAQFDIFKHVWDNFEEIIGFKKSNGKDVVLLLGNHDLHYAIDAVEDGSRYDYIHAQKIKKKFVDNKPLFQLAHEETVGGKRFIFSHAGIHKLWVEDWFGPVVTDENIVDYLNNAYLVNDGSLGRALNQYSAYRGGYESYGSMVWSDIREWYSDSLSKSDYGDVQVFGHTQLKDSPINFDYAYYDLDVRRAFRINDAGKVCEMDGTVVPKTEKKR